MLIPTNIVTEVEVVLSNAANYLSAYQILERLPGNLRNQLIEERGAPGRGQGNSYTAASVVTQAAEMLSDRPGYTREYCDGSHLLFEVDGNFFRAGNEACAFYRIRLPQTQTDRQ